ncbi:MAG: putative sulfate exporter family transporter [Candidatus Sumerlaeota bacterium]|nr:putative sulfate exporter family transporter [Candidatus Sumerlaeota bacterium]
MSEQKSFLKSEDWWAVILGTVIFLLALGASCGRDLLGWAVSVGIWTNVGKALGTVTPGYHGVSGYAAMALTFLFLLGITGVGAWALGANLRRHMTGFALLFLLTFACIVLGSQANVAANRPVDIEKFGLSWSLRLTNEAGLIFALVLGLILGNFFPAFTRFMSEATRPEWFIKTAIVLLGAEVGVKAADNANLASKIMFLGFSAIVVAYLIYWALVYIIARKFFGFSREWAAPLASGISICGVSAAIATGGAIRARPIVPVMVSSLVVIFAVIELLLLPFLAQAFLYKEPMVAAAWMGLAVKTDGGAVASGAITDALIRAKALTAQGIEYKEGWMLMTTTTVKIFIDVFIGVWAFILAIIWCAHIERKEGQRVRAIEIWQRFPKFVLGYVALFAIVLAVCLAHRELIPRTKLATAEINVFRTTFFALTFFAIGLVSDFKRLWQEGIGRLAAVYVLCLFGFIIWIGLGVSWLFFHGVMPQTVQ